MAKRKAFASSTTRKKIIVRDHYACRKCGEEEDLQVHHINPVVLGRDDSEPNLITLCAPCHREWEIVPHPKGMTFEQWLELPPCRYLLAWIAKPSVWDEGTSAKKLREFLLSISQEMRNIPKGIEEERRAWEEEKKA